MSFRRFRQPGHVFDPSQRASAVGASGSATSDMKISGNTQRFKNNRRMSTRLTIQNRLR